MRIRLALTFTIRRDRPYPEEPDQADLDTDTERAVGFQPNPD